MSDQMKKWLVIFILEDFQLGYEGHAIVDALDQDHAVNKAFEVCIQKSSEDNPEWHPTKVDMLVLARDKYLDRDRSCTIVEDVTNHMIERSSGCHDLTSSREMVEPWWKQELDLEESNG